jgi:hypothetical protein
VALENGSEGRREGARPQPLHSLSANGRLPPASALQHDSALPIASVVMQQGGESIDGTLPALPRRDAVQSMVQSLPPTFTVQQIGP